MSVSASPGSPEQTALVQRLFVENSEVIRGFILALLPDFARADDVLQETFLTVTRKAAEFRPGTEFPRWACAIARYKVLEARRRAARAGEELPDDLIEQLAQSPDAWRNDVRLDYLQECLEELAPHTRQALEMRYDEDKSPAQIATVLGWTVESAYSVLSRARSFLRICIERRMVLAGIRQP
ncbi:MAG: sigma-70 family RNA polymerase sigma factor [Verrucomicrobiota bacterium]|nr:sigma-70 family RNA polymerase sigma factor [Verrucomicrobiota bacterium]